MKISFKWLTVPFTNKTKEVKSVQYWKVCWQSRYDSYSWGTSPEMEVFLSKEEAERFAESLRNAFKLIRHTSGNQVTVKKS